MGCPTFKIPLFQEEIKFVFIFLKIIINRVLSRSSIYDVKESGSARVLFKNHLGNIKNIREHNIVNEPDCELPQKLNREITLQVI